MATLAPIALAQVPGPQQAVVPGPIAASPLPVGFAPSTRTEFAPILQLAPPGPKRAERAMALLDRQIDFQKKALHPKVSPALEDLFNRIPPRQSTLIRAASVYSRTDLPWTVKPDGTHELCVDGYPSGDELFITTAPKCQMPEDPFHLAGYFALKPPPKAPADRNLSAVIGTFGGALETNTFGLGALVDAAAATLPAVYGDLHPPWDSAPGNYNHHDVAARQRFRRELPTVDEKLHYYFKFNNILDEFEAPGGPYVLFNFSGEVKPDSLRKYDNLYKFYTSVAPTLTTEADVMDDHGAYWMRSGFDRGKVWLIFMVRAGKLSRFSQDYQPVGEPIAFQNFQHGVNRTRSWVHVRRLGMDFGLDNLSFVNYYTRDGSTVTFDARMDSVPQVVAPFGIEQAAELITGEFMRAVAQGEGGLHSQVTSHTASDGTVHFASMVTAEFIYAPALEFLARIGDAIAEANNDKVRADERKLGEELLDALVKDYNNARPRILALDQDPELTQ